MNSYICKLVAALTVLIVALPPLQASAATLQVYIRYFDSREHRANTSGSLLSTAAQDTNAFVEPGLWIYVWEQDGSCRDYVAGCGESNDDLLKLAVTTTSGYINFGALPTTDPGGSGYPDIYLMTEYANDAHKAQIFDGSTDYPIAVSEVHLEYSVNDVIDWNISCPDDAINTVDGYCDSAAEVATVFGDEEQWANTLQVLTDVRDRFPTTSLERNGHTNTINAHVSCAVSACSGSGCVSSSDAAFACGYDTIVLGTDLGRRNHTIAHEIGHLMMRRSLDYSGSLGNCGSSWTFSSNEDESCVIAEGWADFTAAATYFDNSAADPWKGTTSNNLEGDYGADRCVSVGSSPERRPGNAARFFWDLFDDTTEDDTWISYSDDTTWFHGSGLCEV